MKPNIDNIFQEHTRKIETEFDRKVNKFNEIYAQERAKVLGGKPTLLKAEDKINKIREIVKKLDKVDEYEDFLKYAIKTTSNKKWEAFPPIEKIAKQINSFIRVVKSGEIYKFVFWPTVTQNTGKIFDRDRDTYYGFLSKEILENITPSLEFLCVKEELYKPFKKGKLKTISKENLVFLELVLASMIRFRDKWADIIPEVFRLWKFAKGLPRALPTETIKKVVKEDDNMIYEVD